MNLFHGYFWIFLTKLVQTLFWVFTRIFIRNCSHQAINSTCSWNLCHENYETDSIKSETTTVAGAGFSKFSKDTELNSETPGETTDTIQQESSQFDSNGKDFSDSGNLGLEEEETTKLDFKFQYQTWNYSEEFKGSYGESFDFVNSDKASACTNKYEFISGKSINHFLEEPEASNFTVKELYVHSEVSPLENDSGFLSEIKFKAENYETCVDAEEKLKADKTENLNNDLFVKEISAEGKFHSEHDFICLSFELDSMSSIGEGFLSDTDFGISIELGALENQDEEIAGLTEDDLDLRREKSTKNFDDEDRDIVGELRKSEESRLQNSDVDKMEKLKGDCFQDRHIINYKPEDPVKLNSESLTGLDFEDSNRFDTLWEHQYLVEQLNMELNKVRATGFPTIFETPRIIGDLKPWKIDEKFQHGSTINELPRLYRSYTERMRKFDILNYQKMYAVGSLQSKDQLQPFSSRGKSSPTITSFLPLSFRLCRRKNSEPDPMKKFIRELYSDLEMVYVGHLCLSWEFLKWEYEKALELWESDQYGLQRYNEVAEEFQQFQVLLQRFLENEPFQGPRAENYARTRCVMRNLLQVPVIREDNAGDKKKLIERETDKDAITIDMLVEILEESIRTIWRFIRADKDASSLTHKGSRETQVKPLDPADSEVVLEIRAELQKKEKRINECLKSRRSIVKKFQKHEEEGIDHFYYFFSQVDIKLVWRVFNMSRINRDQLAWCHNKLNKIILVNRRIHVEPSFLLFPC